MIYNNRKIYYFPILMNNSIFQISSEIDNKIEQNNPEPDWDTIIYGWMSDKLLKKQNKLKMKYLNKEFLFFLDGIKFEYGINISIDLKAALENYKKGSSLNEPFSLYKLYTIMKKYSNIFYLNRDRDFEVFCLLRSMAFSDSHYLFNFESIYNIEIIHEVAILIELEDFKLEKVKKLFKKFSSKKDEGYEVTIAIDDIMFTEAIFFLKFHNNEEEQAIALSLLEHLAEKGHLESCYKLASIHRRELKTMHNFIDIKTSYKYFEICYKSMYYKAYSDFALLLYQDKNIERCKCVLLEGLENGYPKNFFIFYDITLSTLPDFNSIESIKILKNLLKYLIKDLVCGNFFSIFEYIYLYNMIKLYSDSEIISKTNYQVELYKILEKLYKNKALLPIYYKELEIEIVLSLAYCNYIGFPGIRNFNFSEELFKNAFKLGSNYSYKRFCYSFVFKIRKKKYNSLVKEMDSIFEKAIYNEKKLELDSCWLKLAKTKHNLHKIYIKSFKINKINEYSSSYFYYLAKIFENGYGVDKNIIVSQHFYQLGYLFKPRNLGSGSIIAYHRKEKSRIILLSNKFSIIESEIKDIKLKSIEYSNEKICEICCTKEKQLIFFPCKHYVCCDNCAEKIIKEIKNCPICRTKILFVK